MDESMKKPMLTPLEDASQAAWQGQGEQGPPKPQVGGSIPSGPAKPSPALVNQAFQWVLGSGLLPFSTCRPDSGRLPGNSIH